MSGNRAGGTTEHEHRSLRELSTNTRPELSNNLVNEALVEKNALWFASLVYLSAVSAYVTTAVKDDDGDVARARDTLRRAAPFFAMIMIGLGGFAAVIWAIQRFT